MDIGRAVELEEEKLSQALANGQITEEEYKEELNWLHRDARGAIEEEAQKAYDEVMNRY